MSFNEFKIFEYRGGEYPSCYEDGQPEFYIKHVKIMEQRYGVDFPRIKKVTIGSSEYPITEIHFEDGLVLYDEEFSPPWTQEENKAKIREWVNSK